MAAPMSVALLALATLVAAQAPGPAKPVPMTVRVEAAPTAQGVAEWTSELSAALEAREDEFRLAKPGEKAELVVWLDSVGRAEDGTPSLKGALVLGELKRSFSYGFTSVRAEALKLARNLRRLADQMKTAGK